MHKSESRRSCHLHASGTGSFLLSGKCLDSSEMYRCRSVLACALGSSGGAASGVCRHEAGADAEEKDRSGSNACHNAWGDSGFRKKHLCPGAQLSAGAG